MICQGKSFLQQHPDSTHRDFVIHLVGQADATWSSLSKQPTSAMADYVDPNVYQEGSEQARLKAIGYFEQVLEHSRGSLLGEAICKRLTLQSCPFSSTLTQSLCDVEG